MVFMHCISFNNINLPTKFLVDTSCSFIVMSRTRCGQISGQTDKRLHKAATICSPFGEHKKYIKPFVNHLYK